MKLLAFTKYGDRAASARQRCLLFTDHLRAAGIELEAAPLLDNDYLDATFSGRPPRKRSIARSYWTRMNRLRRENAAAGIWLQNEFFPYLPAVAETALVRADLPLIVDLGDAIYHGYDLHRRALVRTFLKDKLKPLLQRADLTICGNEYLQEYASQFCRRTAVIPTVVDTQLYRPPAARAPGHRVTIGWIGSPSTWPYVEPLLPMLTDLALRHDLALRIVGAKPPAQTPPRFEFVPWSEPQEVPLVQSMDIGIMPLSDDSWARGKCGYKLIQYMACGLPVVASPVGVNTKIVEHGANGYLAADPADWAEALTQLVEDQALRQRMGEVGRRQVARAYSLAVNGPKIAGLVSDVLERRRTAAATGARPAVP